MTNRTFERGTTWIFGPVEAPKYIRILNGKEDGYLIVSHGGRAIFFNPDDHPDLREAVVVGSCFDDPLRGRGSMREIFSGEPEPTHKLNTDRTVAVATDYFWNEDMRTCPLGAKVQLLGEGGVASYGNYNGRDPFWVAWAPLPKRRTT